MVRILDPTLLVEPVDGHPGQRRLVVIYRLDVPDGDELIGASITETAVVAARDEHDAPVRPSPIEFRLEGSTTVDAAGSVDRRLVDEVHRFELDVEQDWWDTDQAGGTEPIAEFADHLVARITVSIDDRVVASAETPSITGSWGALGSD